MSVSAITYVWECGPESQSDLLVLLALADFADDNFVCWPSIKRVSEKVRLTERGTQKIIRRLESEGWLSISTGGGRKGCNQYQINPERGSPPNVVHPRTRVQKPRTAGAKTLNGGSPEPSRTVKEPSDNINARCELEKVLSPEIAKEVIEHRKKIKKPLTPFAAKKLAAQFEKTGNADHAAETMIVNGWQGFNPAWLSQQGITEPKKSNAETIVEKFARAGSLGA